MDRISTLRNIEEALTRYENGEESLPELERTVRGILRTYATDFYDDATAYRAEGATTVDGLVVVAHSRTEAREKVETLVGEPGRFDVEPVD